MATTRRGRRGRARRGRRGPRCQRRALRPWPGIVRNERLHRRARVEEDGPMSVVVRLVVIAALGVVGLPASAMAAATVDRDPATGVVTIIGDDDADAITFERTPTLDIVTRTGDGITSNTGDCVEVADTVQCPKGSSVAADLGGGNDRLRVIAVPDTVSVAGGAGNDDLSTSGGNDVLAGGPGNDTLRGNSGLDDYFGETGDDTIEARDGRPERIACGAGTDEAHNDFTDIIAECERGIDADGDGFSSAVDCNDGARNVFPGAPEVFDNGVDENCDGRDNPNLDRDGDGFPQPGDCDDANAAIHPGAPEVRGNAVDENCDRRAEPFAQLGAVLTNQWVVARKFARLTTLVVHNAPAGARLVLTCKGRGCPFKKARRRTVTRELQRVVLHRPFRRGGGGLGAPRGPGGAAPPPPGGPPPIFVKRGPAAPEKRGR